VVSACKTSVLIAWADLALLMLSVDNIKVKIQHTSLELNVALKIFSFMDLLVSLLNNLMVLRKWAFSLVVSCHTLYQIHFAF
jgi:hypothetical protein